MRSIFFYHRDINGIETIESLTSESSRYQKKDDKNL